jgi:hypothetical protein
VKSENTVFMLVDGLFFFLDVNETQLHYSNGDFFDITWYLHVHVLPKATVVSML